MTDMIYSKCGKSDFCSDFDSIYIIKTHITDTVYWRQIHHLPVSRSLIQHKYDIADIMTLLANSDTEALQRRSLGQDKGLLLLQFSLSVKWIWIHDLHDTLLCTYDCVQSSANISMMTHGVIIC